MCYKGTALYKDVLISCRENLRFTKEELLGTRDHASRLLKEQGTEMANCSAVIGELTDHMTTVLSGLNKKAGIQVRKKRLGAQWLSGRVLDSRPRDPWFEPHRRHCIVSLSKTH